MCKASEASNLPCALGPSAGHQRRGDRQSEICRYISDADSSASKVGDKWTNQTECQTAAFLGGVDQMGAVFRSTMSQASAYPRQAAKADDA